MAGSKFGDKVKVHTLEGDGEKVGFWLGDAGDGKDKVQVGSTVHSLAYREPSDYDENGPNGTWCKL